MPLTFSKRRISDAENRLRLLFCVNALGLITREQLWPFVARLDLMEYVPMCLFVDELVRDGSLTAGVHAAEGVLYLTDKGQSTMRMFLSRLPRNDRERISAAAPAYAAALQEKRLARAVHELAPEGWYQAACTVTEGDLPTLFLRVTTRQNQLIARIMKHFSSRAPQLLTLLFTLPPAAQPLPLAPAVVSELDEALNGAALDAPFICAFGRHEQSGVICLENADTRLRLALLLPSREAADAWLSAALAQPQPLLERLLAILTGKDKPA